MNDDPTPTDADDEPLPPRLRGDLQRLWPDVQVPPSLDSDILSRAKADYARRIRFRPVFRWVAAAAAMAAAVTLVFVVRMALVAPVRHVVKQGDARGDVNGDGKVNMLDAYILARRIKAGAKPEKAWDVNGDGVVNQQDVDWIANASVSLGSDTAKQGGATR